jgi:predicted branched-subunit amino acid permease
MMALTPGTRRALVAGARATAPALVATSIWGLVAGMAMIKTGLTVAQALAMTLAVYSGTAQMAALPLIAAGAPVWVAIATATAVNLRFVIFSATLWPYLRRLPPGRRLALGYVTADIPLAFLIARFGSVPDGERGSEEQIGFLVGSSSILWVSWQVSSIVGIVAAGQIPGHWGLEFAAILALLSITVPMFNARPALAGGATAAVGAIVMHGLPLKLGLLAAVLCGVAVAMAVDVLAERRGREGAA